MQTVEPASLDEPGAKRARATAHGLVRAAVLARVRVVEERDSLRGEDARELSQVAREADDERSFYERIYVEPRAATDPGPFTPGQPVVALADAAASRGPRMTPDGWTAHVRYMGSLLVRSREDAGIVDPPRLLSGRDIMVRFGMPEGPRIGALLEELREAQAAGDVRDRSEALGFIRERIGDTEDGDNRAP